MLAEIKGLKTIYHNNDEAFITRGYRNWRHATENLRVHEEYCPLLKHFVMSMKALIKD